MTHVRLIPLFSSQQNEEKYELLIETVNQRISRQNECITDLEGQIDAKNEVRRL